MHTFKKVNKNIIFILASSFFYYLTFSVNQQFFNAYEFSFGVNWIFIPSGVQLLLVLVAGVYGAIGIFLASVVIGLQNYYLDSVFLTLITAFISGSSPLLARKICIDFLGVRKNLSNITFSLIVKMSLIFGLISASLHQVWFFYNNKSDAFINDLVVMFSGDIAGTMLVLLLVSFLNMIVLKNMPKRIDDE
jgi:hypothetical protein